MISFLNRADPFSRVCLFVRNKIYVLEIEMLGPVVVARNLQFNHGCVNGKKALVLKRPPHNVSAVAPIGHVWLLSAHLIYIFILPI